MDPTVSSASKSREKLGLALAGGGFRASLFHLGVLRRMAELDILREVEVLSTVSGGSIVGALYVLLLKQQLDKRDTLPRSDYLGIVQRTQEILVRAIQKNLRTRLFWNPLGILRVMLTSHSLGKRMARLYERHIYAEPVAKLKSQNFWRPGKFPLIDLRFTPGGKSIAEHGGLEAYNAQAHCKVPNFILNATCLNSGSPFRFSSVEIGDPRLGYFRHDEVEGELLPRKRLIEQFLAKPHTVATNRREQFARWWAEFRLGDGAPPLPPVQFINNHELRENPGFLLPLLQADFGALRRCKLAAWYVLRGAQRGIHGRFTRDEYMQLVWKELEEINSTLYQSLVTEVDKDQERELLEFLLELYYLRSAEVMSHNLQRDLANLSLGEAVGASACFPPVFPPYLETGIYDDRWVARLGLTDGGVYDNMGITALLQEGCTCIVASDTGGLFQVAPRVSTGRIGMSARIVSILSDAVGGFQRSEIQERRRVDRDLEPLRKLDDRVEQIQAARGLGELVYFQINSLPVSWPGLETNSDRDLLAKVRTDLDAFGDVEVAALVNQGYRTADRFFEKYSRSAASGGAVALPDPIPPQAPPERVNNILQVSRRRFFRALYLFAPLSLIFSIGALAGVAWWMWIHRSMPVSIARISSWLGDLTGRLIYDLLDRYTLGLFRAELALGMLVLLAVAIAGLTLLWKRAVVRARFKSTWLGTIATIFKWLRTGSTNWLWLLGAAPLWIALGGAAAACISYFIFGKPFLWATRNIGSWEETEKPKADAARAA